MDGFSRWFSEYGAYAASWLALGAVLAICALKWHNRVRIIRMAQRRPYSCCHAPHAVVIAQAAMLTIWTIIVIVTTIMRIQGNVLFAIAGSLFFFTQHNWIIFESDAGHLYYRDDLSFNTVRCVITGFDEKKDHYKAYIDIEDPRHKAFVIQLHKSEEDKLKELIERQKLILHHQERPEELV